MDLTDSNDWRLGIVRVNPKMFLRVLGQGANPISGKSIDVLAPDGSVLDRALVTYVAASYDFASQQFDILITHDALPFVDSGCAAPVLQLQIRT